MIDYDNVLPDAFPVSLLLTPNQTQELVRVLVLTKRAGLPGALSFAIVSAESDPKVRQVWLSKVAAQYLWTYDKTPSQIKDAVRAELDALADEQRILRIAQGSEG